ncbi:hypothetical protein TNCV_3499651 [Trichonephila clavipes]|nr:hypothetical protein TNCV_3499651 [Trichonephila clavipes]
MAHRATMWLHSLEIALAYNSRTTLVCIHATIMDQRYCKMCCRLLQPVLYGCPMLFISSIAPKRILYGISQCAVMDAQMSPSPLSFSNISPIEHVRDGNGHGLLMTRSEDVLLQMVDRKCPASLRMSFLLSLTVFRHVVSSVSFDGSTNLLR